MDHRAEDSISIISIPILLIIAAVFLFAALLQRERELALWGICVIGLTAVARIWSLAGIRKLYCMSSVDRSRIFPGDYITLKVEVENKKMLPVLVRLGIDLNSRGLEPDDDSCVRRETGLLWHQMAGFRWKLTAIHRGVYMVGTAGVEAGDYLGFYRKRKALEPVEVIVYPRVSPLAELPLSGRDFFGKSGLHSPVHDPVYILGTRDYQHWQPARYIHWKASSRYNRLMEKIFDPSEQEKILIAVDVAGFAEDEASEDFERTLEEAASLAVHLEDNGIMAGFITNAALKGDGRAVIKPGRGTVQLSAILETMARMERRSEHSLIDTFSRGRVFSRGISCVLFVHSEDEIKTPEAYLKNRCIPVTALAACTQAVEGVADA